MTSFIESCLSFLHFEFLHPGNNQDSFIFSEIKSLFGFKIQFRFSQDKMNQL